MKINQKPYHRFSVAPASCPATTPFASKLDWFDQLGEGSLAIGLDLLVRIHREQLFHARVSRRFPERLRAYVYSNFFWNFWLIFGKLWEVLSRFYQRQMLKYIDVGKLLARSRKVRYFCAFGTTFAPLNIKNSEEFRRSFPHFYTFVVKICSQHFYFCSSDESDPKSTDFDFFRNFSNLYGKCQQLLDSSQIS